MAAKGHSTRRFYDPFYEVVTLEQRLWDDGLDSDTLQEITETYEFNRLNFLKQEGLTWLEFPSVTHTRFSAALGCWFLADWAMNNVPVHTANERVISLGNRLEELGWREEFRLAFLLHDIGHFPFTAALENNDFINMKYLEVFGIHLRQEVFNLGLIEGERAETAESKAVFERYMDYMKNQLGDQDSDARSLITRRFISRRLGELFDEGKIDRDKLIYMLSSVRETPDTISLDSGSYRLSDDDKRFLRLARHLRVGIIDLGLLDRYKRLFQFVSGGTIPVQGLLSFLSIRVDDNCLALSGDGITHALQIVFTVKRALLSNVFHNRKNLAFEIMLNAALIRYWQQVEEKADPQLFRASLPFMEDGELLRTLMTSGDQKVREIMRGIRLRRPFQCVGQFTLGEDEYENLVRKDDVGLQLELKKSRRRALLDRFENLGCYVRLTKSFGDSGRAHGQKEDRRRIFGGARESGYPPEWMDSERISVIVRDKTQSLSTIRAHGKFLDMIRYQEEHQNRMFWLYREVSSSPGYEIKCEEALKVAMEMCFEKTGGECHLGNKTNW